MDENYIPFGSEWKSEMMKLKKSDIIDLYRKSRLELQNIKLNMNLSNEKQ